MRVQPADCSESALVHTQAVALFTQLGNQDSLNFQLRHKATIDRFGRYSLVCSPCPFRETELNPAHAMELDYRDLQRGGAGFLERARASF